MGRITLRGYFNSPYCRPHTHPLASPRSPLQTRAVCIPGRPPWEPAKPGEYSTLPTARANPGAPAHYETTADEDSGEPTPDPTSNLSRNATPLRESPPPTEIRHPVQAPYGVPEVEQRMIQTLHGHTAVNIYSPSNGGITVLLLHGCGGKKEHWSEGQMAQMLAQRFRVVAFDWYGHGESSPLDHYTKEAPFTRIRMLLSPEYSCSCHPNTHAPVTLLLTWDLF